MDKIYIYPDIRQSDPWLSFWECMGWKKISFGINLSVRILKNIFGVSIVIEKPQDISEKQLLEIEKYAQENSAVYLQIKPSLYQDTDIFDQHHYEYVKKPNGVTKTGIINLQTSLDVQLKKLSYRVRRLINTSQEKTTVTIKKDFSDQELQQFFEVYKQNGLSKNFFTYSQNNIFNFMKSFKNNAYLCIVNDINENYLGGCVLVFFEKTVWYMFSAVNNKGRENDVGYAMLWNSIKFIKNEGFTYMDLEGLYDERYPAAFQGHQKYTEFKQHFHPDVVYFPKIRIKYFNKLYRFLDHV